jgi:hypothetical protein
MRAKRGIFVACIVAALAFAITIAGTASAAPGVSKAAKRCKKRHSAKKRKNCRKRRTDATRSPVIRATLTWSNGGADGVDLDLFVFDGNGGVAGHGSNTIPLTSMTPDALGPAGHETFTDGLFTPQSARDLSFGVCYVAGAPARIDFTLTYVTADGVVHGDSQTAGQTTRFEYPGGAAIPSGFCMR